MSSYADVYVKGCSILSFRNYLPDFSTDIFNDCDIVREFGLKASNIAIKYGLDYLADWLAQDEKNEMIILLQKASVIKKRLAVYGYTEDYYKSKMTEILDEEKRNLEESIRENPGDEWDSKRLARLERFRLNGDKNIKLLDRIKTIKPTQGDWIIDLIPDDLIFYGCVRNLKDDDYVILDCTEIYGNSDFDVKKLFKLKVGNPIIMVEGPNDYDILSQSLKLIYPELVDNITFLDKDTYKVESNAGAAVTMIKSFAGAGIKNRVLAVLDNDAAAQSALRAIETKGIKLPDNLRIIQYPNIKICERYPTIGPQGESVMDINGSAGSIEMYLGKDILTKNNELEKVIWTSYKEDVKKYQGELINKKEVNKRFGDMIKIVKKGENPCDLTDLKTLWDHIISQLGLVKPAEY